MATSKQFLVNQCLLSCCINTITVNENDWIVWAQSCKLFCFKCKNGGESLVHLAAKLWVCLISRSKS